MIHTITKFPILQRLTLPIEGFGAFLLYLRELLGLMIKGPFRRKVFFQQLEFIGNQSIAIILLTGGFTGAVFALQIGGIFQVFRAEGLMGGATAIALVKELAPLVSGFLLAGRAGSAMAAELATMRVNEQIDAMEAMAVDPMHYLIVPRVYASLLMMPLLCGVFMLVGVIGAYLTGIYLFEVDRGVFVEKLILLVKSQDVVGGLRKMFVFSFIIASICCRTGLNAKGGAKGVGNATTDAVVRTLVTILAVDFVMSYIEVRWFS